MKVSYNGTKAYLDDEPLADGTYVGTNKHTELPVHLRWDGEEWIEVCVRWWDLPTYRHVINESWVEMGERPDCTCVGHTQEPRVLS